MNILRRIRSRPRDEQAFEPPKYGGPFYLHMFRSYAMLSQRVGRFTLEAWLVLPAAGVLIVLLSWHLVGSGFVSSALALERIDVYYTTLLIWGLCILFLTSSFLTVRINGRLALSWMGFRTSETHRRTVAAVEKPRMLIWTRMFCYMIVAITGTTTLWWLTVLPNLGFGWMQIEPWNWSPGIALLTQMWVWVGPIAASFHLEKMWFIRRTKLPLIMAGAGVFTLIVVVYGWAINNLGYWWIESQCMLCS